jgi:hypothetical protein
MKILRIIGIAFAALVAVLFVGAGIARLVINGPIGPLAGGELDGSERQAPADWNFTDEHFTIAVEVQPADPHSVTVVCFVSDGELYIPAQNAAKKKWPQMALENGHARVRVGDDLYPIELVRVDDDFERERAFQAAGEKYPRLAEQAGGQIPDDVWLFRAERRPGFKIASDGSRLDELRHDSGQLFATTLLKEVASTLNRDMGLAFRSRHILPESQIATGGDSVVVGECA